MDVIYERPTKSFLNTKIHNLDCLRVAFNNLNFFSGLCRCGHCQRLAPIWNDLATALEHDESVNIAKLDCTEYRPICKDFDVKGYPTLLWVEDSKKVDKYSGPRTVEDLKAYVENRLASKTGEAKETKEEEKPTKEATEEGEGDVVVALSADNFQQVIKNDITFIKFFAPWYITTHLPP